MLFYQVLSNQWWRRIEALLFACFLIAIPIQFRHILYHADWYFNEWRSASIYLSDFLVFGLFLFWYVNNRTQKAKLQLNLIDWLLAAFLITAIVSLIHTYSLTVGVFYLVKLIESIALFYYFRSYAVERFSMKLSLSSLVIGGVIQSLIGAGQFFAQRSLGLKLLGESVLSVDMTGVAVFLNQTGNKIMRAYGTTPHPNILAAYLLIAMAAWYGLVVFTDIKKSWILWLSYSLTLGVFLLTFSRTIIATWVLGMAIWYAVIYKRSPERRVILKKIFRSTLIICAIFSLLFWGDVLNRFKVSSQDEAVSLRLYYNGQALSSGKGHIDLFGVGIGNFVSWFMSTYPHLPKYLYQPAHNVYLLIYSEMGIVGVAIWITLLILIAWRNYSGLIQDKTLSVSMLFICVLFISLFDHFPWTLQQGRLILWPLLGVVAGLRRY